MVLSLFGLKKEENESLPKPMFKDSTVLTWRCPLLPKNCYLELFPKD